MSRRPRSSQTVALFPFLAVLVCTMGSLIFLLLVTTRMIRDRATAQSVTELTSPPTLPVMSISTPARPTAPPLTAVKQEPDPDAEPPVDLRAIALEQRQRELDALMSRWNSRLEELNNAREERARLLAQRKQLQQGAAQRVAALQAELNELEVKLGTMTGKLSASAVGDGTIRERIELETQIKELKRRLRAAQQADPGDNKFEVVPFDVMSGTSRRPILIECTSEGLRFIPEDIMIKPDDLAGFSPHVNPLVVGASALVNYWTAWNIRQPNPGRQPEPYVLLLVRPSGTIAYYVAMKMLVDLNKPHGYELIEEDTELQMPPVDAGARAAVEAAVNRLLAERSQVLRQGGLGIGRGGAGGRGSGTLGGTAVAPAGSRPGSSSSPASVSGSGQFELSDIMDQGDVGNRNWERVENFEGPRRGNPSRPGRTGSAKGSPAGRGTGTGGQASSSSGTLAVTAGTRGVDGTPRAAARPGTVPSAESSDGSSGIETLEGTEEKDSSSAKPSGQPGGTGIDTGLGSSGNRSVPVDDRRGKKKKSTDRELPTEPEQLANRHWGISDYSAAIGLEREVRIDVEKNRYVVGKKHAVPLVDTDSSEDTFAKLVTVLDLQAHDWGKPPQGFFWKPSLKYVIADGGDANYERVHSLFERAGLTSTHEYPGEPPEIVPPKHVTPAPTAPAPAPKPPRRFFRGILP
ncbi:MAG: hypothetical protein JSS49_12095 [Planctomycetes bacterium]|nr:hypothetical protein [Planctomycetota bacterium]